MIPTASNHWGKSNQDARVREPLIYSEGLAVEDMPHISQTRRCSRNGAKQNPRFLLFDSEKSRGRVRFPRWLSHLVLIGLGCLSLLPTVQAADPDPTVLDPISFASIVQVLAGLATVFAVFSTRGVRNSGVFAQAFEPYPQPRRWGHARRRQLVTWDPGSHRNGASGGRAASVRRNPRRYSLPACI